MDHPSQEDPRLPDDRQQNSPGARLPTDPSLSFALEGTSSGSLIAPISKEGAIRQHMQSDSHLNTQLSPFPREEEKEVERPRYPLYPKPLPPPSTFSDWGLPILLFGLTAFTTLWAGAYQVNTKPVTGAWDFLSKYPDSLINGLPFAATLLGILVTHEMGHYILSRIHRVPASFPLFIPGPPQFIGTFGAVIRMRSPIMRRRALFDIGVAGPIAGFFAAVVALIIGLSFSYVIPKEQAFGLQLGEPLLLQGFAWLMFGPIPPTHDLVLHPIAFAAWFGFFVTAINLLPLGQLDGGHVAFAVFGQQQRQDRKSVV